MKTFIHRKIVIAIVCATAALAACGGSITGITLAEPLFLDHEDCQRIDTRPLVSEQVKLQFRDIELRIDAEIASEAPQRTQGFMCRSDIAPGTGMYFELPAESTRGFWMFNTYVPLDIVYLDPDGLTVEIATLAPCQRRSEETDNEWRARCELESLPHAPTDHPYLDVLELPAGWLESHGVPLKDAIELLVVERR